MRQSGILMHISSLPGPDGIGSMGKEAFAFADFLHAAGMDIWQVLPMGPTGYGESPYQSTSVFAGNPLLISVKKLEEEGLFKRPRGMTYVPENPEQVDYERTRAHKMALLRAAYAQSEKKLDQELAAFAAENAWVQDFALFTAIKNHFDQKMYTQWPDLGAQRRKKSALDRYRRELADEIRFHLWCQYIFARQWYALKQYCNALGISLLGDMPIYVAEDSADTWVNPDVFQLGRDLKPLKVAGVPPDYFSQDGQLWGNPLYRWKHLRNQGYGWWVQRMAHMQKMYDIVRIDHFIGFANYYSIPYGAPNARNGEWIIGPGKKLFDVLNEQLPGLTVVAEDLGAVNNRVRALLKYVKYPGMKVLTFAFGGGDDNMHLPANIPENTAYYTGTHDNQTAAAWAETASEEEMDQARRVAHFKNRKDAPWALIRTLFLSRACIAVVPMQDVLALPAWATMNHPGTVSGNWLWRMKPRAATPKIAEKLAALNQERHKG